MRKVAPGEALAELVEAAREAMARLELHPRDALPNATALACADALYVELSGPQRETLGHAIAMLRAALESQDPREIEPLRERLLTLTAALERR